MTAGEGLLVQGSICATFATVMLVVYWTTDDHPITGLLTAGKTLAAISFVSFIVGVWVMVVTS